MVVKGCFGGESPLADITLVRLALLPIHIGQAVKPPRKMYPLHVLVDEPQLLKYLVTEQAAEFHLCQVLNLHGYVDLRVHLYLILERILL